MKTVLTTLILIAGVLGSASNALAVTTLKQVQVSGGSQVDLLFDAKVGKNQVKTEFFNDIVQISLTDVAVYPAKISSVNNGSLTKIFAYQYAPKLVRCRFSVKGKAEDYKDRVKVSPNGKILTVRFGDGKTEKADNISLQAAAPVRTSITNPDDKGPAIVAVPAASDTALKIGNTETKEKPIEIRGAEERALLDRVMAAPAAKAAKPLASAKPLPSFFNVFIKLAAVIALFLGIAFLMRGVLGTQGRKADREAAGMVGAISRYARSSLGKLGAISAPLGRKEKIVELISTHHLGPKKSIVIAKVCGRMLVLGVSNESINLITELSGDGELDLEGLASVNEPADPKISFGAGATAAGPAVFADLLNAEKNRPAMGNTPVTPKISPAGSAAAQYAATQNIVQPSPSQQQASVRAQIRSRLEGLKPL